jgi:hypothetical protein
MSDDVFVRKSDYIELVDDYSDVSERYSVDVLANIESLQITSNISNTNANHYQ